MKLTQEQRVAAAECIRLICLLVESTNVENSKVLARIVGLRLCAIVDGVKLETYEDHDIEQWVAVAREISSTETAGGWII